MIKNIMNFNVPDAKAKDIDLASGTHRTAAFN